MSDTTLRNCAVTLECPNCGCGVISEATLMPREVLVEDAIVNADGEIEVQSWGEETDFPEAEDFDPAGRWACANPDCRQNFNDPIIKKEEDDG